MRRAKLAIFDFACCEGCQLQIVNLEEDILNLLGVVRPVEWREAMSEKADKIDRYDIALVEGSITREEDEKRLTDIRDRSQILIALGACAATGGVNKLKNDLGPGEANRIVYGEAADMPHLKTAPVKALHEVVNVDYNVHGCPIDASELGRVVRSFLAGKVPDTIDHPLCVECKLRENACRFEYGEICLGPITRAGCGAFCPTNHTGCWGCRGFLDEANIHAAIEVMKEHDKTIDDLKDKALLFNSPWSSAHESNR